MSAFCLWKVVEKWRVLSLKFFLKFHFWFYEKNILKLLVKGQRTNHYETFWRNLHLKVCRSYEKNILKTHVKDLLVLGNIYTSTRLVLKKILLFFWKYNLKFTFGPWKNIYFYIHVWCFKNQSMFGHWKIFKSSLGPFSFLI